MPDLTRLEVDLRRLARTLTGAGTLPSCQDVMRSTPSSAVGCTDI
jgi:hypothetical protein